MNYPEFDSLNNLTIQERYIKRHYFEFYNFLIEKFPNIGWKEKIYCFYHNIQEPPKCPICGNKLKITTFFNGYQHYCSKKCAYKDSERTKHIVETQRLRYGGVGFESKELMNKTKKTIIDRYGVEYVLHSEKIKEKIKQTNLRKYGAENPMQNKEINKKEVETQRQRYGGVGFESKELMNKTKKTNIERYGVENNFLSKEVQKQCRETRIQKYGTPYYNNREKAKQTMLNNYGVINTCLLQSNTIIDYTPNENGEYKRKCPHPECTKCQEKFYWADPVIYGGRKQNERELCTRLLPVSNYTKNTTLEIFIHRILDECGIKYEKNNRKILDGKELDIYIPSKRVAIECNGVYWHSVECISPKDELYHFNKWKKCKGKGIELLTIWDCQIYENSDTIKDLILKKLGIIEYKKICNKDTYIANNDFDFIPEGFVFDKSFPPEKHIINDMTYYDCGKSVYKKV